MLDLLLKHTALFLHEQQLAFAGNPFVGASLQLDLKFKTLTRSFLLCKEKDLRNKQQLPGVEIVSIYIVESFI